VEDIGETGLAMSRNSSDEEDAVGVHFEVFVRMDERCLCEMSQFAAWNSKTVTGAKGQL
jgi:hypothetical protein